MRDTNKITLPYLLETITNLALKFGNTIEFVECHLLPEFEDFIVKKEIFRASPEESAASWWVKRRDGGFLRTIATRVAHLKASSANIERTFSTLKYIQGPNRLRLALDRLVDIGRIKIKASNESTERLVETPAPTEFTRVQNTEMLSLETRALYEQFTKYIDFSKITDIESISVPSEQRAEQKTVKQLIQVSRNSRALKRRLL